MTAFFISILASIASETGKAILKNLSGSKTIVDNIEKAFENSLKKWTVNDDIQRKESIHIANRTVLLKQIVLEYENNKSINKNIQELLALFKLELMSDAVGFNFLIDNYFQDSIKRSNRIEGKIDNIYDVIVDSSKQIESPNKNSTEIVTIPVEKEIATISNIHFLSGLEKEPFYISRTLVNYKNIDKEKNQFNDKTEEDINLRELILKESRIVLLGSAGTGKSIELKEAAIDIANSEKYFPIFLTLNTFSPEDKIEDNLPEEWLSISEKDIILFLDGLDEIEPSQFNNAKRRIAQFSKKYTNLKIVVSCRTNFYELPVNNKVGTLRDFKPFYIKELSLNDVKNYVIKNYSYDGNDFINAVFNNNLDDLVFNPFFLKLIIQNYKDNEGKLLSNRVELFREFINSRLVLDENHFAETINISDEKFKALNLLRKISLSMEMIGVRTINEIDLRKIVVETEEFNLIKYCTVFKKEEGITGQWKFEHNYFQEFLCAELLSEQPFEIVKSFISYNDYEKVLPTWFNTVAQLISIIDSGSSLFQQLSEWLIKNDSEVLVNVEREKLSASTREQIFIQIFEYYKGLKIWIDSNKFREKDLAYFGQSNKCIKYISELIVDPKEARIVRLNALNVLGGFLFTNYPENDVIKNYLVNVLIEQFEDSNFAFTVINTLTSCGFTDDKTVTKVFDIVCNKNSRYIRASMYKYLVKANKFECYVDYYLDGFKILKTKDDTRGETSLADESWNLREGIKQFKSVNSLIAILKFCTSENYLERSYDSSNVFQSIISNCIETYKDEPSIFDYVLKLMNYFSRRWLNNEGKLVFDFFIKTDTKQKAFESTLELIKNGNGHYSLSVLLSHFVDENNFIGVINEYQKGNIDKVFIQRFYWDIRNASIELAEDYKLAVQKKSDVVIEIPKQINWEEVRRKRAQASFDLLFDRASFKKEALRVFGDKTSLNWDELWEIRKSTSILQELEDLFINSALDFVREFARNNSPAIKSIVENWFIKNSNVEHFFIVEIFQTIKNNESLQISENQIKEIKKWFDKYINIIDFKVAVTKNKNGGFSINYYACYLVFFMQRFDFKCEDSKLLDMLSFAFGNLIGMETIQFDYVINKIKDIEKVNERVIENINSHNIAEYSIYETHIEFALSNNLNQCYPAIILDLVTSDLKDYQKNKIIDLFFKSQQNISELKSICDELEIEVQLHLFEKLIITKEKSFVVRKLNSLSSLDLDVEIMRSVNNLLITTKQILGLEKSINWIITNKQNPFSQNGQGLSYYEDIKALPFLITLLELSYDSSITSEHSFDRMWSFVVNGLEYLALSSKENYTIVLARMRSFIDDNKGKLENVEFLNRPIETIKEKYYNNETIKYDLETAMTKIESLLSI